LRGQIADGRYEACVTSPLSQPGKSRRARQVEAEQLAAEGSSFDALAAILTPQSAPAAQTAPQPKPRLKGPATPVTQPTIAPARAAAREKLGQLRVEYGADSFVKQATEGDTIAVNLFLAAAMNINALDKEGYTALIGAARARQTETVQALIAAGADVNIAATPNSGAPGSALSFAARNGDLATIQVLLSGGAQVLKGRRRRRAHRIDISC
jgi:ankyrin repeat protein